MPEPIMQFVAHEDVVFRKAPLESVLCQVRFSPIYALLDEAGFVGFQEALRHHYPRTTTDHEVELAVDAKQTNVHRRAPVWRMQDDEGLWTVSVAIDFVSLETRRYSDFREFRERFATILSAVDRTLSPSKSKRLGLRKVNLFEHPDVTQHAEWTQYLRSELMGLVTDVGLPGRLAGAYSEAHIGDGRNGTLVVRFGPDTKEPLKFRLDLDYATQQPFSVSPRSSLLDRVESYSHSMTSFFHWSLKPSLYDYLEPHSRTEG